MQSRRNESALPNEKHLQEYRGRESYEQQSKTGRRGRSAAFPQHDYPAYAERNSALDTLDDEYAMDDDYSRTDYGPYAHGLPPAAHPEVPAGLERSDASATRKKARAHVLKLGKA